jgi:hypothetical protein
VTEEEEEKREEEEKYIDKLPIGTTVELYI